MRITAFLLMGLSTLALSAQDKKPFTLDDIFRNGTFAAKGAPGFEVMNDGLSYSIMTNDGDNDWKICKIDLETGKDTQVIFSSTSLSRSIAPESYEFSADEKYLLLTEKTERIYRHSTRAFAFVVNIASKTLTEVSAEKVMYPQISPDNSRVAYVRDNDMYVLDIASGNTLRISSDGKKNAIINGAVDWVYEEEFSMSQGYAWSPDSKEIAYYRFDESGVKEFSMSMYNGLYPTQETWKYPKAGEANSVVDVYVYQIASGKNTKLETGSTNDQYLPRIHWTQEPNKLCVIRLNRFQNEMDMLCFNTSTGSSEILLHESSPTYVEITDNLTFITGSKKFLYTSEKSGFNHIYCFDYEKKKETAITTGNFDVIAIQGVDAKKEIVYFTSAEISPTEDHFYSIKFNGKDKKALTPEPGNHIITLGKGNLYFTDIISTIGTPYAFSLRKTSKAWSRKLEQNEMLQGKLNEYRFGGVEFSNLTTESGTNLNYYMIKPWNFDPSKKYPVLMYVYGGPGHNTVRNSWGGRNYLWHQYLSQQGYIVVSVDNRGTGNRGEAFKKSTYLQLGKLEHQDQREAALWLGKLPFVDAGRIGIWGWSFGGYMSSLCISKSGDVFKTAIAVAPVTNWRYYDNIYTERYLRRPSDNAEGYDQNSPINFAKNIKGNYLLIHGTGDDNVHFQNSVEMVNAMIAAGVKFDSEYYPNRNHGIGDRYAQYHLYRRMSEYILEKL